MYLDETDSKLSRYDMILGRDLLEELGIDFLFSQGLMTWDNASVPMHNPLWLNASRIDELENYFFSMHDPVTTEVEHIQEILDAKYAPTDIDAIATECKHLTKQEQQLLQNILTK
jgi:hypothetical protein